MTGQSSRILVLDDSPPYLDFMRMLLSMEGFEVTTVSTAQAAQSALRQGRFDLIITDAMLPGLAPLSIVDLLRQEPEAAGLPIVVCSGAVRELDAARERLELQGVAVMEKPFDIEELLSRITTLISENGHSPNTG